MSLDLEQACLVMKKIMEHVKEGGSYRYLIYNRMGFGPEAYAAMMEAGGLDFSNLCPFPEVSDEPRIVRLTIGTISEIEKFDDGSMRVTVSDSKGFWESHKEPTIGDKAVSYYVVGPGYGKPVTVPIEDYSWSAYEHSD